MDAINLRKSPLDCGTGAVFTLIPRDEPLSSLFSFKSRAICDSWVEDWLKFVSEDLKKNRELVLKFIRKNGLSLEYVPLEFQNDREIVFQAIYHSGLGDLIRFASDELKNDLLIAYIATKYSKTAHEYLNDAIKKQLVEFEDKYGQMIHLDYFLFD